MAGSMLGRWIHIDQWSGWVWGLCMCPPSFPGPGLLSSNSVLFCLSCHSMAEELWFDLGGKELMTLPGLPTSSSA